MKSCFQVNNDLMFYGLYSKGFRAGGFNGRPLGGEYEAAATPYDPPRADEPGKPIHTDAGAAGESALVPLGH